VIFLCGAAVLGMIMVMSAAWVAQQRTGNCGWVDAYWSLGVGAIGAACALVPIGEPALWRAWLVAALALFWGGRLGFYLVARTRASAREDVRYARFRAEWGADFGRRLFGLLMVQALAGALLAICVMLAARNPAPGLRGGDVAGALLVAVALLGEAVADRQMHRFRAAPANRGRVCDAGLWGWSRHPNYFFECLLWGGYPLIAIPWGAWHVYPWGVAALAGPASITWLLTRVSGIPPLEREMLESRPESYRAYQLRVSAFLPWPPRAAVKQGMAA
jgi:steroid 5-alpha reductase family enzyme